MHVKEVTIDLFGCDPSLIDDIDHLKKALSGLAEKVGTRVVSTAQHKYHPQGASVTIFVEESHLMISTWPEHGIAVFNCLLTHGPDPHDLSDELKRSLKASSSKVCQNHRKWEVQEWK